MKQIHEIETIQIKAVLVGIVTEEEPLPVLKDSLEELEGLLTTLSFESVGTVIQYKDSRDPRTRIGKGKLEELRDLVAKTEANLVVFDVELSPSQARNLDEALQMEVMDRTGVILKIFDQNAKTYEAKLQVELAQQKYELSRLKRKWTHLSRQQGGRGIMAGEGETQLEVDRRISRDKIQLLQRKLEKIQRQRETRKNNRESFFKVAIVGYTNSGKSTLLNCLTNSDVLVEDKLFATLDPSTRMIDSEEKPAILFSDTVGFIKKLPHHLVASFRSTFEQIQDSSLLLHVVDISDPSFKSRIEDTNKVLKELELDVIPCQMVFNKVDKIGLNSVQAKMIQSVYPNSVQISAHEDVNIDKLKSKVYDRLKDAMAEVTIQAPLGSEKHLQPLFDLTRVLNMEYTQEAIEVRCRGAAKDINAILSRLEQEGLLLGKEEHEINEYPGLSALH